MTGDGPQTGSRHEPTRPQTGSRHEPTRPQTGSRHEPERIHERAADPAEASNRPLEPRAPGDELLADDETPPSPEQDAHHRLNTPVGDTHAGADSDPYREPEEQDEDDRASGTTGSGQGAER